MEATQTAQEEPKPGDDDYKFIHYIRERDAAREELKKMEGELRAANSKLYDAFSTIESLEKKVAQLEKGKPAQNAKPPAKGGPKKDQKKGQTLKKPEQSLNASTVSLNNRVAPTTGEGCGVVHPALPDLSVDNTSCNYYVKIADRFKNIPMYQVLEAEKKFVKADVDNSGTIDKDELDKVLTQTVTMFTPKQIDAIFAELDTDNSGTVDFIEVLTILDRLVQRKRTNLPQSVQQNYSKTCSIQ